MVLISCREPEHYPATWELTGDLQSIADGLAEQWGLLPARAAEWADEVAARVERIYHEQIVVLVPEKPEAYRGDNDDIDLAVEVDRAGEVWFEWHEVDGKVEGWAHPGRAQAFVVNANGISQTCLRNGVYEILLDALAIVVAHEIGHAYNLTHNDRSGIMSRGLDLRVGVDIPLMSDEEMAHVLATINEP